MPIDPHASDEGDLDAADAGGAGRPFREFECPLCSAHNPYDDGFSDGDEVRCFYCGQDFRIGVSGAGALKLREV